MEDEQQCGNCRYWQADYHSPKDVYQYGWCRRHSPRGKNNCFPVTGADQWCGDYAVKEDGIVKTFTLSVPVDDESP